MFNTYIQYIRNDKQRVILDPISVIFTYHNSRPKANKTHTNMYYLT